MAKDDTILYGLPLEGNASFVQTPYGSIGQVVDTAGYDAGGSFKCPYTGKILRVPEPTWSLAEVKAKNEEIKNKGKTMADRVQTPAEAPATTPPAADTKLSLSDALKQLSEDSKKTWASAIQAFELAKDEAAEKAPKTLEEWKAALAAKTTEYASVTGALADLGDGAKKKLEELKKAAEGGTEGLSAFAKQQKEELDAKAKEEMEKAKEGKGNSGLFALVAGGIALVVGLLTQIGTLATLIIAAIAGGAVYMGVQASNKAKQEAAGAPSTPGGEAPKKDEPGQSATVALDASDLDKLAKLAKLDDTQMSAVNFQMIDVANANHASEAERLKLDKNEAKVLLEKLGVSPEAMTQAETGFDKAFPNGIPLTKVQQTAPGK